MKFKIREIKNVRFHVGKLTNYAYFEEENSLNGDGRNHFIFVTTIMLLYTLIITSAWLVNPIILILGPVLYHFTKNPFRFRYNKNLIWRWGNDKKFKYYWHKRIRILGLDIYILNGLVFSPNKSLKKGIKQSFDDMEEQLNKTCM